MDDNKLPAQIFFKCGFRRRLRSGSGTSLAQAGHFLPLLYSAIVHFLFLNIFFCLLFLATGPKSKFVRFHALQSLMIGSYDTHFIILFLSVPLHFIQQCQRFYDRRTLLLSFYLSNGYCGGKPFHDVSQAHQGSLYRCLSFGHYADLYSSGSNLDRTLKFPECGSGTKNTKVTLLN
ncbi:MAG: hypothetical protein R3C24_11895 [Cyanobacteriota/Melainabacteria group bacterium]